MSHDDDDLYKIKHWEIIPMTKLVTCTFCGQTMDSDDCVEHGVLVHNFTMAKVIQKKLWELEAMATQITGKPVKLRPSDILNDDLLQYFLDLSQKLREKDR